MKKLLIFSLALAVTIGMAYSAGLTVNSPSGGTWYKGSTHNVTWTSTGACTGTNVKINIFKNSVDPANFIEQLTSTADGTEPWTIGMGYTNGTYVIRVKYADNSCYGDSSPFTVTDAPSGAASITVNNPHSGTDWCIDTTKSISWTTSGVPNGTGLKINIFRNSISPANFVEQLVTTNGLGAGSKSWSISSGTYTPGNYQIRIKTNDDTVSGDSAVFHLKSCGGGGPTIPPWLIEKLKQLREVWWWRHPHPPGPGPWPPGPCLSCPPEFDLGKLKELIANAKLKEQIQVELFKDGAKFADLGKFGPPASPRMMKGKVVRMQKMQNMRTLKLAKIMPLQNRLVLRNLAPVKSKALEGGKGFKLIFRNASGKLLFETPVFMKQKMMKQLKEIKQIR